MFAQSGQGGLFGQMSSKPRSSGDRSPKYSNSSFPVDLGGGGLLGSLSRNKDNLGKVQTMLKFKRSFVSTNNHHKRIGSFSLIFKVNLVYIMEKKILRGKEMAETEAFRKNFIQFMNSSLTRLNQILTEDLNISSCYSELIFTNTIIGSLVSPLRQAQTQSRPGTQSWVTII